MLRTAILPTLILTGGLAIAAIVHAQEPGSATTRNRTTLVDQLARIRDELAGRSTPQPVQNHDEPDLSQMVPLNYDGGQVAAQPLPPSGAVQSVQSATPEIYENPYALPGDFQPARQARSTTAPSAGQQIIVTPVPGASPPAQAAQAGGEKLTLQQRLARLIQGDGQAGSRPEPRSAIASGPGTPNVAAPQSGIPTPAPSLPVQLNSRPAGAPGASSDLAAQAPTSRLLTPDDVIPSMAAARNSDEFLHVEQSPQLTTSVSGPKSVNVGQTASYTVVLQNVGSIDAGEVSVALDLPAWAEVSRAVPTSGAIQAAAGAGPAAGAIVWRMPAIVAQSRERLELDVVPRDSRPLEMAVRVTQSPLATTSVVDVKEPKLQIVIAGPDELQYGEEKVYQLTVSNPGDGIADDVSIDLLPLTGQSGAADSSQLGQLKPGDSKTIDIALTARQAGTLSVKAQATARGGLSSAVEKSVLVRRAGLRLDVAAPEAQYASTPVKYLIRVSNPGNATARKVKVTATLPPGAEFKNANIGGKAAASGAVTWTLDALASQDAKVLELDCVLNNPGANRLQVVSDAQNDLSDTAVAATDVVAVADLKLEVSDPQGPVAVGDPAMYKVIVRNRGTKAAEAVEIATFFSEGVEPVEASGGQNQIGPGQVVFQAIDRLGPGEERVLEIKAVANREGNHSFRTELVCRPLDTRLIAEETTRFYGGPVTSDGDALQEAPHTALLEPLPSGADR